MNAKTELPKISDNEASRLSEAAHNAISDPAADKFFEEVIERARHFDKVFAEADQQTRTE